MTTRPVYAAILCCLVAQGCKPTTTSSSVKTLTDLAGGGAETALCYGNEPAPTVDAPVAAERDVSADKKLTSDLMNALGLALTAVPDNMRSAFAVVPGDTIRFARSVDAVCRAALSPLEVAVATRNGGPITACFINKDGGNRIYLAATTKDVQRNTVRMFARYFSEVFASLPQAMTPEMRKAYPGFVGSAATFQVWQDRLTQTFISEVAALQAKGGKASTATFTPFLQTPAGRLLLNRLVFADASDSYFCNATTRATMTRSFPKSAAMFAAWATALKQDNVAASAFKKAAWYKPGGLALDGEAPSWVERLPIIGGLASAWNGGSKAQAQVASAYDTLADPNASPQQVSQAMAQAQKGNQQTFAAAGQGAFSSTVDAYSTVTPVGGKTLAFTTSAAQGNYTQAVTGLAGGKIGGKVGGPFGEVAGGYVGGANYAPSSSSGTATAGGTSTQTAPLSSIQVPGSSQTAAATGSSGSSSGSDEPASSSGSTSGGWLGAVVTGGLAAGGVVGAGIAKVCGFGSKLMLDDATCSAGGDTAAPAAPSGDTASDAGGASTSDGSAAAATDASVAASTDVGVTDDTSSDGE